MRPNDPPHAATLEATLSLAVPLWIHRVREWSVEHRLERARACAQIVAEKGDVLQYGGKKGEAADAFNRLAEGLAIAAFQPGGVKFRGMHWESR